MSILAPDFTSVYGPVTSWRYGKSLGIDPIGSVSVCSFDCVYCQLGKIERLQLNRDIFIPTNRIIEDLQRFTPWDVDGITLSGSGEPTLAVNLGEILESIAKLTQKPTIVLTNGTLLDDPQVRQDLQSADKVALKIDGVSKEQVRRVNRPVGGSELADIWSGMEIFSQNYPGELAIQTMLLSPWDESSQREYIDLIQRLNPKEIQLNTPTRPKPLQRQLDGRGNHSPEDVRPYQVQLLKSVDRQVLRDFAARIEATTKIPVRYP